MNKDKFTLFARNLLSQHSASIEITGNVPSERFLINSDPTALVETVFSSNDGILILSIYYENGDWREGSMEITKRFDAESNETVAPITNYSKETKHLLHWLMNDEDALTCGG